MTSSSKFHIIVYGASGFTGQLVAEDLTLHYKNDGQLKWAMAGRGLDKLASVRDGFGAPKNTPLIAAESNDAGALKAMIAQTRSVISTVGPYQLYGNDPLAACISFMSRARLTAAGFAPRSRATGTPVMARPQG
jgi:short subunit dehydrogenase-like uncharacterized protein